MNIERNKFLITIKDMYSQGYTYLVKITAVDYIKTLTVIYILRDIEKNKDQILEVNMPEEDLWIESIMNVYNAADWYERELHEMFGIKIKGRKLKRLLLEKSINEVPSGNATVF